MAHFSRLVDLEARMDEQLRQFGYTAEEEEPAMARRAVQGAAVGALAGGGVAAYQNRGAIAAAGKDAARKGLKKTAGAAESAAGGLFKTAVNSQGVKQRAAGAGMSLAQKTATGLRKVAKSFSRADVDVILGLAERINGLERSNVIEFKDYGPQRDPENIYKSGGREALVARDNFRDKGHVYRNRDAMVDNYKGKAVGVGAGTLAAGAVGAGVLGSRKLIQATAAGKVPKGPLRKGAVKVSKVLRKAGRSKGLAIAGGVGALVAGKAASVVAQRNSAANRLVKREKNA